jgi:hypothetical protein
VGAAMAVIAATMAPAAPASAVVGPTASRPSLADGAPVDATLLHAACVDAVLGAAASGHATRLGFAVRLTAGAGAAWLGHAHRGTCPDGTGTATSTAEPATEPTRSSGQ